MSGASTRTAWPSIALTIAAGVAITFPQSRLGASAPEPPEQRSGGAGGGSVLPPPVAPPPAGSDAPVTVGPPPATSTPTPPTTSPQLGDAATTVAPPAAAPAAVPAALAPGAADAADSPPSTDAQAPGGSATGPRLPLAVGVAGPLRQGPAADPFQQVDFEALRVLPGRFQPMIERPGRGVPVEASVSWTGNEALAPIAANVTVFMYSRAHPALGWDITKMKLVPGTLDRHQAVIPCAPCQARPEYWFEAFVEVAGPQGPVPLISWWPQAGASIPARYDVGYERVLASAPGATLQRGGQSSFAPPTPPAPLFPGGNRRLGRAPAEPTGLGPAPAQAAIAPQPLVAGGTDWTGPVWTIGDAIAPRVALSWSLEAVEESAALVIAVRPGGMGPWRVVDRLEGPRGRWLPLSIVIEDHLPGTAVVQVRAWLEGPGDIAAAIALPRLVDITCVPTFGPDIDQDGVVGLNDLLLVLMAVGPCQTPAGCPQDMNGDGMIDILDVLLVLSQWQDSGDQDAPAA